MRALVLCVPLALAACGGGGGSADAMPDSGMWTGDDLAGPCPLANRVGSFVVDSGGNAPVIYGAVADSVLPLTVLTELGAGGGCKLLKRENPFCDPPCSGQQTCSLDEVCVPYPRNQSAGTVSISGLTAAVEMEPDTTKAYQDTSLAAPLFAEGAQIQLDAAGAEVPRFTLRGIGVEDLALGSTTITIVPGTDLMIPYTASGRTDVEVWLKLNVDQHGNSPGRLECIQDDTGTVTIPAAMVDMLLDLGQSGVPNAEIARRTVDSVTVGPGCVDFTVQESFPPNQLDVSVEGVFYCEPPMMCPPELTCNPVTFICE